MAPPPRTPQGGSTPLVPDNLVWSPTTLRPSFLVRDYERFRLFLMLSIHPAERGEFLPLGYMHIDFKLPTPTSINACFCLVQEKVSRKRKYWEETSTRPTPSKCIKSKVEASYPLSWKLWRSVFNIATYTLYDGKKIREIETELQFYMLFNIQ